MIKRPECSVGSLSNSSGSRAFPETSFVRGTLAEVSRRSRGSVELISQRVMNRAMLLSMMVLITS